jgi:hypothetical protein
MTATDGVGSVANGSQWTGGQWVALPTFAPATRHRTPWYRRPWVLVLASLLGSIVILSVLGIGPADGSAGQIPGGHGQGHGDA